jgi:hypothetical protein
VIRRSAVVVSMDVAGHRSWWEVRSAWGRLLAPRPVWRARCPLRSVHAAGSRAA